jgi:hypothetical protein
MPSVDKEWDERRLCPDGVCVGVLDNEGICKVCGKRGGVPVEGHQQPHAHVPALEHDRHDEEVVTVTPTTAVEPDADGAFDDERELCSDGACIGVIGANGRCSVCSKPRG